MSRYIDKDLLEKKLLSMYDETQPRSEYNAGYDDCICTVQDMVSDIPEADVVEVVRCKDCKYCIDSNCYMSNLKSGGSYLGKIHFVGKNDYCSYGERKENEQ